VAVAREVASPVRGSHRGLRRTGVQASAAAAVVGTAARRACGRPAPARPAPGHHRAMVRRCCSLASTVTTGCRGRRPGISMRRRFPSRRQQSRPTARA
jgi:hypothetical protein